LYFYPWLTIVVS